MAIKPLKVSEVNNFIKKLIYSNPLLNNINIIGEVEDLKRSHSGIRFFSLKDEKGEILRCICFDEDVEIEDGVEIIASGKIDVYSKNSLYQLVVKKTVSVKGGEGYNRLERLKEKLFKKGYFDPSNKKPIPKFPKKLGVITSINSAALQDILKVLNSYKLGLDISIYDSQVQGNMAADKIIKGIEYFNAVDDIDLILISRGGGSKFDLEVFNKESIANYIFESKKPIVCGIGHETDVSIADLTADLYSNTPTGAAKLIIENYIIYIDRLDFYKEGLNQKIRNSIQRNYNYVNLNKNKLLLFSPFKKIGDFVNHIDHLKNKITSTTLENLNNYNRLIEDYRFRIGKYDYNDIFNKGFVFINDDKDNIINSINMINLNKKYSVIFKDGEKYIKFLEDGV